MVMPQFYCNKQMILKGNIVSELPSTVDKSPNGRSSHPIFNIKKNEILLRNNSIEDI